MCLLLDAIEELKDQGLTALKVIRPSSAIGYSLEDEGPPLVGVPRHDGTYNRVERPHPFGGGR